MCRLAGLCLAYKQGRSASQLGTGVPGRAYWGIMVQPDRAKQNKANSYSEKSKAFRSPCQPACLFGILFEMAGPFISINPPRHCRQLVSMRVLYLFLRLNKREYQHEENGMKTRSIKVAESNPPVTSGAYCI